MGVFMVVKECIELLVLGQQPNEQLRPSQFQGETNTNASDPVLPNPFDEVVRDLSQQFTCSAASVLTPSLTFAGGVVGNSMVLETNAFSSPLNACLDCAVIENSPEVEFLMQTLAQPLRDQQDQRIAALGDLSAKDIKAKLRTIEEEEASFFGQALFRDAEAQASFQDRKRKWEDLLCPILLVENLAPGLLHNAVMRSGGNGLMDLRNALAVRGLLNARKKGKADFEVKTRAFQNKTREATLLEDNRGATPVRPAISGLLHCDRQTMASLLCSSDGTIKQFLAQLIIVSPDFSGRTAAYRSAAVPDSWRTLIANLVNQRTTQSRRLSLSPVASALLSQYIQEIERQREPGRLDRLAPILAAKSALIFSASTGESRDEIPEAIMSAAIEFSRQAIRETNLAANRCISAEQSSGRESNQRRVLQIVAAESQISERDLQRSANLKIEQVRSLLNELVHAGQVRYAEPGIVEIVRPPQAQSN